MKVLLIVPKVPTRFAEAHGFAKNVYGGWIDGYVNVFDGREIDVSFITLSKSSRQHISKASQGNIESIYIEYNDPKQLRSMTGFDEYDVVEIVGIEHEYIPDLTKIVPVDKTIINITGLNSEYAKVYEDDATDVNFLQKLYINVLKNKMVEQGRPEERLMKKVKYGFGRTLWDKKVLESHNPDIKYFHCGESLRDEFYGPNNWGVDSINRHQMFVSTMSYPIKGGLHALRIIRKIHDVYPDLKVRVSGENMIEADSLLTKLGISYSAMLKHFIRSKGLNDVVDFTGLLNAEEITEELGKTHVVLVPSAMENSSNSLQEAMASGVPVVATDRGGTSSILGDDYPCLYDFNNVDDAVNKIIRIFNDDDFAIQISKENKAKVDKLIDKDAIYQSQLNAFRHIAGE